VGIGSWVSRAVLLDGAFGFMAVTLSFYAVALLSLVGMLLGAIGLLQRRRKRLFAVLLGVLFNGVVLSGVLVLFWPGMRINS
jgi:hypothetical protein